jgi:hypothetical protein
LFRKAPTVEVGVLFEVAALFFNDECASNRGVQTSIVVSANLLDDLHRSVAVPCPRSAKFDLQDQTIDLREINVIAQRVAAFALSICMGIHLRLPMSNTLQMSSALLF